MKGKIEQLTKNPKVEQLLVMFLQACEDASKEYGLINIVGLLKKVKKIEDDRQDEK